MIELLWNSPVGVASMTRTIEALDLSPGARVLDVGCGCGEPLLRVCERYSAVGVGFDTSDECLTEARRRVEARGSSIEVTFVEASPDSFDGPSEFDLVTCFGSTHAFGTEAPLLMHALRGMRELARPGGLLLVGEGYAAQPPAPEYVELLGGAIMEESHADNVALGRSLGLVPLGAWTCSAEEWDDFEWGYQRVVEARAAANPGDIEGAARIERRRRWMDGYLRYGRDTLGFGTYLFRA